MTVGAILFARMTSARLRGKALVPIGKRPLLGHILDRVRRVHSLDGIALATSYDSSDDQLAAFAQDEGIPCWRGPLYNVLERAIGCARWQGWETVARICGDRVFLNPRDVEAGVRRMRRGGADLDLVSNVAEGPVAPGLTVEVVRTSALERVRDSTRDARDLEHVTRYIYRHRSRFVIEPLAPPPPATAGHRFVVDSAFDLKRSRAIVAACPAPSKAAHEDILRLTLEWEARTGAADLAASRMRTVSRSQVSR